MLKIRVLILRNTIDCYGWNGSKRFAPMIDSIPRLMSEKKEIHFLTITTTGSIVKLPSQNLYDSFFKYFSFFEKVLRKLGGFSQKYCYVEYYYWRAFLRRNKITKVLCIEPGQSFLKACMRLSIDVCEVQHGVVGISQENVHEDNLFPNFFLSWDERSATNALQRSFYKTRSLVGCNMALYHYVSKNLDKSIFRLDSKSKKKNVLISLQWGLFGPHLYNELELEDSYLPKELLEYMVSSTEHYNFIFRLHPVSKQIGEINQIFNSLHNFGLIESISELEQVSNIPLFKQLDEIDLHVTLYSSITIEASYLGIPTLLLDPALKKGGFREKYFEKEINDQIAFLVDINNLETGFKKASRLNDAPRMSHSILFERCERSISKFLGVD